MRGVISLKGQTADIRERTAPHRRSRSGVNDIFDLVLEGSVNFHISMITSCYHRQGPITESGAK